MKSKLSKDHPEKNYACFRKRRKKRVFLSLKKPQIRRSIEEETKSKKTWKLLASPVALSVSLCDSLRLSKALVPHV